MHLAKSHFVYYVMLCHAIPCYAMLCYEICELLGNFTVMMTRLVLPKTITFLFGIIVIYLLCSNLVGFPLDIDDIRLANGSSSGNGRVEIKSLGTWGTICHDDFGMNEAHTICRMLNMW